MSKVILESNLEYYERMAKLFPNEPIWKRAAEDTRKLLKRMDKTKKT